MPTDPRLKETTDEQASILFQYWVSYDEDVIRKLWRERANRPQFSTEDLRDLGYTDEEAAGIKEALEKG